MLSEFMIVEYDDLEDTIKELSSKKKQVCICIKLCTHISENFYFPVLFLHRRKARQKPWYLEGL